MSFLKRFLTDSTDQPSQFSQPVPKTASRTARNLILPGILVVIAAAALTMPYGSHVLAKTARQSEAKAASADIDPDAVDAVKKMSAYLRTLKAFQVKADVTNDDVLDSGQNIQSNKKVDMIAVAPNRLRADISGDGFHRILLFDGKNFTLFGVLVNYYATVPAPATTVELVKDLNDKYGIEVPLVDLFLWGTKESDISKITSATDIGPSDVEGVSCEHYAFRQEGVDWQIWIQLGEYPLPRKFVIVSQTDDARPQHTDVLTWNLAPSYSDDAFTFDPPPNARRITFAEIKNGSAGNNK